MGPFRLPSRSKAGQTALPPNYSQKCATVDNTRNPIRSILSLSMRLARRDARAAAAEQEIEICAGIRLLDVVHIKLLVTALHRVHRRLPLAAPLFQLFWRNVQMQTSRVHV